MSISSWAACQRADLPHIRFHDLRHTAATLLLLQGVHPKVVSEMLGHASIAITLDLYSHVLPDMHREATVAMEGAWAGTGAATRWRQGWRQSDKRHERQ